MAKIYQSRQFLELSREWDTKLQRSGLVDIEETVGGEKVLKQNSANAFRQASRIERDTRPEYFSMIAECWHKENWQCPIDRCIMLGVSEGLKIKDISLLVNKLLGPRKSERKTIRYIIRKYEHKWGIRLWRKDQLTWNKVG
jgi:hypothetical protein